MGDNFETACTALRTNVPAGACKDENLSPCFQSLMLKFAFQRHLPLVERAALQARHLRPFSSEEKTSGEEKELFPGRGESLAGERFWQMRVGLALVDP